jgi:hypothetical protein
MKVRFVILWAILAVGLLASVPMFFFITVQGSYAPPPSGSAEARVPPLPAVSPAGGTPNEDGVTISTETPVGVSVEQSAAAAEAWMAARMKAFYLRHPVLPEKSMPNWPENVPEGLFDMGFAVLKEIESDQVFLEFVRHSDPAVRAAAIRALSASQGAMSADGAQAMVGFLSRQSQDDLEWLVLAAAEVLIEDTQAGKQGASYSLLMFMGDYAHSALPHLIWASNNHPDPGMREWIMNAAAMLDPEAPEVQSLLGRRLFDSDPGLRRNALFMSLLSPIASYQYQQHQYPAWYLQLRPGDEVQDEEGIGTAQVEEKRLAASGV